jgi:hypothetical protein
VSNTPDTKPAVLPKLRRAGGQAVNVAPVKTQFPACFLRMMTAVRRRSFHRPASGNDFSSQKRENRRKHTALINADAPEPHNSQEKSSNSSFRPF